MGENICIKKIQGYGLSVLAPFCLLCALLWGRQVCSMLLLREIPPGKYKYAKIKCSQKVLIFLGVKFNYRVDITNEEANKRWFKLNERDI